MADLKNLLRLKGLLLKGNRPELLQRVLGNLAKYAPTDLDSVGLPQATAANKRRSSESDDESDPENVPGRVDPPQTYKDDTIRAKCANWEAEYLDDPSLGLPYPAARSANRNKWKRDGSSLDVHAARGRFVRCLAAHRLRCHRACDLYDGLFGGPCCSNTSTPTLAVGRCVLRHAARPANLLLNPWVPPARYSCVAMRRRPRGRHVAAPQLMTSSDGGAGGDGDAGGEAAARGGRRGGGGRDGGRGGGCGLAAGRRPWRRHPHHVLARAGHRAGRRRQGQHGGRALSR